MSAQDTSDLSFEVPDDADPVRCPDCGRPFVREDLLVMHRGENHGAILDDEANAEFARVHGAEDEAIRRFRLKAVLALTVLYFVLLMIYALV